MVRDTSSSTYYAIEANGLLSKRRFEVYSALFKHGPCTANELFDQMQKGEARNAANITTRLGELRKQGVAVEIEQRPCKVTGHQANVWDVTSKLPSDFVAKKRRYWWLVIAEFGDAEEVFMRKGDAEVLAAKGKRELVKVAEVAS